MSQVMNLADIRPDKPMQSLFVERQKMIERCGELFIEQPENFITNEACPLCGSEECSEYGVKGFTRYMRCACCELLYLEREPKDCLRFGPITASPAADVAVEAVQATTYETRKVKKFGAVLDRLMEIADPREPLRVLDIGCGSGYFLDLLRDRTAWTGLGVELNDKAVRTARARGLQIVQEPIALFQPDQLFDILVCVGVLGHISRPERMALDCHRLLKDGGLMLVRTPNYAGFEMQVVDMQHNHFDPMETMVVHNIASMKMFLEKGGFEAMEISTPGLLDVEIVRQQVRVFGCELEAGRFEKRLIFEESPEMETARHEFSRFLVNNNMSGLMQAVARKIPAQVG
ncbi:MAG: class I SAM-dependent methyltransferase [Pseudodesulfovibrio sp.]|nr:class I SAM-dependent methyltransferase [Pseudodesulfovibrio sp.]